MKKKILSAVIFLLAFSNIAIANAPASSPKKVIGIVLEAPATYANNQTVRELVPEKVAVLFPEDRFIVLPFEQTSAAVRTYREDKRLPDSGDHFVPLNREDIMTLLKPLNCDYAFFIKVTNSQPRTSSGVFTSTARTTVTCDIRLLDLKTGQYKITKEIIKDGRSTSGPMYGGSPSLNRAYERALNSALDEIQIDTSDL